MSSTLRRLEEVAEINPRAARHLVADDSISFVPMSALDAEIGRTSQGEDRPYQEVSKGYTSFLNGDLLVAKITPCFENGKIGQAELRHEFGFGSTEFHVIRPDPNVLDARYLLHYLRQKTIRVEGEKKMTGSGGQRRVPAKYLSELKICVPVLTEQKRIAAILDQAESLRSKRRAALEQLDALALSLLDGLLDESAESEVFNSVGEIAEVQGGLQVTSARKSNEIEVPYLRVANVYRGFLALDEIKNIHVTSAELARTALVDNDILVVEGHGNANEVGRCALWDGSISPCVHQNHLIRVRVDSARAEPRFVCDYLNSPEGRRHLLRSGKTTSGLNTISVSNVRDAPISLPALEVQRSYVKQIGAIEQARTMKRKHLAEMDSLFTSLQHRAFRGEL